MSKYFILFAAFTLSLQSAFAFSADDWKSDPVPSDLVRVTVVFTNDIHGGIMRSEADFLNPEFPPALGGGTSAYRIIKALRERAKKDNQCFFVVDAGDIYQGAPIGTVTKGEAIIDYFNYIGMEAVVVGNHDLDQGFWTLDSMIAHSHFPWISANLRKKGTDSIYGGLHPWIIKEFGGVKIGIVGLTTTSTKFMSFPKNVAPIEFEDEIPALKRSMAEAKAAGAQAIWVAFHHGIMFDEEANYQRIVSVENTTGFKHEWVGDAQELAHRVPGVDIMFAGHIHMGKPKGWIEPKTHTFMVQNYGHGGDLGVIDFYLDKKTGHLVKYKMPTDNSMLLLLQEDQWGRDSELDKKIQAVVDTVEKGMDEVIGVAQDNLPAGEANAPMVKLVADAMLDWGKTDVSFQNTGGVRESLPVGNITRREVFNVEPFGNELVSFNVTGKFLKDIFIRRASSERLGLGMAGAVVTFDGTKKGDDKIIKIEFTNGKAFNPDSIYSVTTTDYLLMGNSGMEMLKQVPEDNVDWMGVRLADAITRYIERKTPIKPVAEARWIDVAENNK